MLFLLHFRRVSSNENVQENQIAALRVTLALQASPIRARSNGKGQRVDAFILHQHESARLG